MRDEGPDFLARQVIAMIEEEGALAIGAVPCPNPGHAWVTDSPSMHEEEVDIGCHGCGAVV